MLKKISITALLTVLFSLAACHSRADWSGIYLYSEDLGEDPGGAAMSVEYRLELGDGHCLLDISGYQSDTRIRCILDANGDSATVRFLSYGSGEVKNIYGVQVYQVEEALFTLRQDPDTEALVTEWEGLLPDSIESKTGHFFDRQ